VKRTEEDQQFGMEFAKRLQTFYDRAIAEGGTEKAFARRLGVDRGGLQRYLKKHATPSLRTAVLAFREFGICIPHSGVDTLPLVSKKGGKRRRLSELQMDLPLTIEAPQGEIDVVIKKKSAQRYRLQLHVRKTG
jgi:transcriptional regulator with XRE-family HTH domain